MDLKEFDAHLHDAEVKLKRLKALYEQWFQGIERIEPTVARKELDRLLAMLTKNRPRNTAARFRLQQLSARYSIYATYWGRIARQIEEGTYERDVRRAARRRQTSQPHTSTKTYELDLDEDIPLDDLFGDEISSMLAELEASVSAPPPKRPALSAFSPFAMMPKKRAASETKLAPSTSSAKSESAPSGPAPPPAESAIPSPAPPPAKPAAPKPPVPPPTPAAVPKPVPPPPPPFRKPGPPPPPPPAALRSTAKDEPPKKKGPVTATFSKPKPE